MTDDPNKQLQSMFSSIDVTASTAGDDTPTQDKSQEGALMVALLRRMIAQQDKTNDLLQELIQQGRLQQQARQTELERKQSNPNWLVLSYYGSFKRRPTNSCNVTNEVDENEYLRDSDYMLQSSSIGGPRLAHLNGVPGSFPIGRERRFMLRLSGRATATVAADESSLCQSSAGGNVVFRYSLRLKNSHRLTD